MTGHRSPDQPQPSVGEPLVRASLAVAVAHALFKLVGLVQAIVVGKHLDGATFDAVYAFAFEGCIFTLFLIGEESIGPSFLPVFMREKSERGERPAWQFANAVLTVQFLILLAAVFLIVFRPDGVVRLVTFWRVAANPEKFRLGRTALVWLAPSLICLSLGSTTYMLLNGYKRFFLAAFGDASWKLCVLLSVLVGMGLFGLDHRAVIFGLLAGSVAKLATHLLGLVREIRFYRPSLALRNPAARRMFVLMLPLLFGIFFAKFRDLFNNVTVLSYLETDGLLKANSFGRKLYTSIGWLVPYAIAIAMFPFLCELADRNDREKFGRLLTTAGRMLLSVFIPLSLVCVVLARPLCLLILAGGRFTVAEAEWTSVSMACYTLVLPAFALEFLLMQAFFAHRRMVCVTVVGVVFSALSVAVSYIGVIVCGRSGIAALAVVALGFTVSRTLKTGTLIALLRRSVPLFAGRESARFLGRALLVGAASCAACYACREGAGALLVPGHNKARLLAQLALGGAGGLAGFWVALRFCRLEEPVQMLRWAVARLRARRPRRRSQQES